MIAPDSPAPHWNAKTEDIARRGLRECGYLDDLIREEVAMPDNAGGLLAFAHRPCDVRSANIAVIPSDGADVERVFRCREYGPPLVWVAADTRWTLWQQARSANDLPRVLHTLRASEVPAYMAAEKTKFAPQAIFRAKMWSRADVGQLEFVGPEFLPELEEEAGEKLRALFESLIQTSMAALRWDKVSEDRAQWLLKTNFWLLSAKLLHDKRVERFRQIDLLDIPEVFRRVAHHYDRKNPQPPLINATQRKALEQAASLVVRGPNFRNLSAETLGAFYDESRISKLTLDVLNTHRTPTHLVDYMLAKLSPWIEDLGAEQCRVFEPACGHAPFLSGALRLLSDILPPRIAADPAARNKLLRKNLSGCDHDPGALEIARLSLTLADIPNENGWILESGNMFSRGKLTDGVAKNNVILANPPFSDEQAAKFFRLTVGALQPGAIFGLVLPINEFHGPACADARRQLLRECEIREISVFPDRMFKYASVETGVVLGRKHPTRSARASGFIEFRRIRESGYEAFRDGYRASWGEKFTAEWLLRENDARFLVPELCKLWEHCRDLPKFERFARIGQGLIHRSQSDPKFPKGAITESTKPVAGLAKGFASMDDSPDTHLEPTIRWLNLDPRVIRRPVAGTEVGTPQVVMNYAPVDRDAWRLKAFIDEIGRPATSDFLLLRPKGFSLEILWALCNSPLVNAWAYSFGTKRHTTAGVLRRMPVPDLAASDLSRVEKAAGDYLEAARAFSVWLGTPRTKLDRRKRGQTKPAATGDQMLMGVAGERNEEEIEVRKEHLRALHWRMDAEVLRLYGLPAKLERELLDLFCGVARRGVPFHQERYIPRVCAAVETLHDFLCITDEWERHEDRRSALIDQKLEGPLKESQEKQLRELKRLFSLRRRALQPFPPPEMEELARRVARKLGER